MNGEVDLSHAMRLFSHGPLGLDPQPFLRDVMPRTESPHKIAHTACDGPDEELHRTKSGVLAAVLDRLIGDNPVLATDNVVTHSTVIGD
jgi:hypothetical protein